MVTQRRRGNRTLVATALVAAAVVGSVVTWRLVRPGTPETESAAGGNVVHSGRSGTLDVVVLSPSGTLRTGRNTFTVEFRAQSGGLVDVGTVRVGATMTMPGMVMPGNAQVQPTGVPGRFTVTAEFGMAGAWPITVEWDGPAGPGAVTFEGSVQ